MQAELFVSANARQWGEAATAGLQVAAVYRSSPFRINKTRLKANMTSKRILVTGGGSFPGIPLCEVLLQQGQEVHLQPEA